MYSVLGFINVALLIAIVLPYVLRKAGGLAPVFKKPFFTGLQKTLRKLHKLLAALLLVSVVVHGWLALGALRLHTGTVAAAALFITAGLGLTFYLYKRKKIFTAHKVAALCSVLLVAIHLLVPNLLR